MSQLGYARYGKDNIRLCKVHRDPTTGTQSVIELTIRILLEGDIATSYTAADNSVVVATDSQKQTCYVLAKQHLDPRAPPELFAATLAHHFITRYAHIHATHVRLTVHRWSRLTVDGKPHPHSFLRDGAEVRTVDCVGRDGQGRGPSPSPFRSFSAPASTTGPSADEQKAGLEIHSGISGLLVLKTTGSAFHGFVRDEYTRLPETWDRIFSTEVECRWRWAHFGDMEAVKATIGAKGDEAWETARRVTVETFAKDESASVQSTMFKMSEQILEAVPEVEQVDYALPNKHYFEIDLSWFDGLSNTGKDAEVYSPQTDPNGLIECSVTREGKTVVVAS